VQAANPTVPWRKTKPVNFLNVDVASGAERAGNAINSEAHHLRMRAIVIGESSWQAWCSAGS
jgi:hypothetical protein